MVKTTERNSFFYISLREKETMYQQLLSYSSRPTHLVTLKSESRVVTLRAKIAHTYTQKKKGSYITRA